MDAVGVEHEPIPGHEINEVMPHVLQSGSGDGIGEQVAVSEGGAIHRVVEVGQEPRIVQPVLAGLGGHLVGLAEVRVVEGHGLQPSTVHQLHPAVAQVGDDRHQARTVSGTPADERDSRGGRAGGGGRVLPARVERGDGGVSVGKRSVEQVLNGLEVAAGR